MFLPTLLVRDLGTSAFWSFAIPNILGAAAMGFVLRSTGSSERMVAAHPTAMRVFSWVTVSFQWYFAVWMIHGQSGNHLWWLLAFKGAFSLLFLITFFFRSRVLQSLLWLAGLVWMVSFGVFVFGLTSPGGGLSSQGENHLAFPSFQPPTHLPSAIGLLLVCLLGFILCPYGDLTFHRARQSLPGRAGVWAFALGFGVFFFAMILLTLCYAPLATQRFDLTQSLSHTDTPGSAGGPPLGDLGKSMLTKLLFLHLGLQLAFTILAHKVELTSSAPSKLVFNRESLLRIAAVAPVVLATGVPILLLALGLDRTLPWAGQLTLGELAYRSFMVFYGLLFPAYALICMVPQPRMMGVTKQRLVVLLVTVAAASPFYWMGFIERRFEWLIAGVGIVLCGWAFRPPAKRDEPHAKPESSPTK